MGLFRKKCEYCKKKIEKGQEIFKDVKNPISVGTKQKAFCCSKHAENYIKEMEEYLEICKNKGGGCCG